MPATYPAKVLLFGEHTILRGGRGLAVPYPDLSLSWTTGEADQRLLAFAAYLQDKMPVWALHAGAMKSFLSAGNRLTGDLPTGYGLGSSGAVCAAFWDRFATKKGRQLQGEDLRQILALMEGHFHGSSSGTDPLICYLQQPVLLGGGQPPRPVELPEDWSKNFFLVDTGVERSAATYIDRFTQRYDTDPVFAQKTDEKWRAAADACCTALLEGDRPTLYREFWKISLFQGQQLADFIPPGYHEKWQSLGYILKLCGAGGGGVLLGYALEPEAVETGFERVWWL